MTYRRELRLTAQRLRQLTEQRLMGHSQAVRDLLAEMTDRPVPELPPHAWGDQLAVIGGEVPPDAQEDLIAKLVALRRGFDLLA